MRQYLTTFLLCFVILGQPLTNKGQGVQNRKTHIVQAGENVYRISLKYNLPMDSIKKWNSLDPNYFILAGQTLIVSNLSAKTDFKKENIQQVTHVADMKDAKSLPENEKVKMGELKDGLSSKGIETDKSRDVTNSNLTALSKTTVVQDLNHDTLLVKNTTPAQDTTDLSFLLQKARDRAYNNGKIISRQICRQILKIDSTYYDASVLMGRTYLWDDKSDSARVVLIKVITESPGYYDAVDALIDVEIMTDNNEKAIKYADIGLNFHPDNANFLYKKARALNNANFPQKALDIIGQILAKDPADENAKALQTSIRYGKLKNTYTVDAYVYSFSNDNALWYFGSTSIGRKFPKFGSIIFRYNYAQRYGRIGHQFEIDSYPTIVNGIYLYTNLGFSNKSNFPLLRFTLEPYFKLPDAFEFSIGFRYLNFDDHRLVTFDQNKVMIYTGTIGKYVGNYWISFRPYLVPGSVQWSKSFNLTVRRYLSDEQNYLSLTVGTGYSPDEQQFIYNPFLYILKSYKANFEFQHRIGKRFIINLSPAYALEELTEGSYRTRITYDIGGSFLF